MASRKTGYVLTGFILALIGGLAIFIAFATPHWMEPFQKNEGIIEIENLGLWQYCFQGYTASRPGIGDIDVAGKRYTGCKWVFHREVEFIRSEICPNWFQLTQALVSLALAFSFFVALMGVIFLCLHMCSSYPSQREAKFYFILGAFSEIAGYLSAGAVIVFGMFSDSKEWAIKEPASYHLSFSYFILAIGGGFSVFAGMFLVLAGLQVRADGIAKKPNYKPKLEMATLTPTAKY